MGQWVYEDTGFGDEWQSFDERKLGKTVGNKEVVDVGHEIRILPCTQIS